ncbi:glycosyltransferase family 4 protein [Oleispirillum naphthae]|uniref:MraY family glycosyltransferase n=1 Tax=Oleispirillum naphthae TaxID=2838853 RepID=UPI00308235BB
MTPGLLFGGFCLAGAAATGLALRWLRARRILDMPNARSSHAVPTPRGGGLAVTPLVLGGLAVWFSSHGGSAADWAMLAGALLLAAVSWIDDRRTLTPLPRFAAQIVAAAAVLALMPKSAILGGLLPSWAEKLVLGLAWVWFVNLFNFMDGIDGITGVETIAIALGLFVAAPGVLAGGPLAIVAGTTLGFLVWNWHPAKIFMGDVGSIPLGFVLGYLLLSMTALHPAGWAVALILPAVYWADATVTLARRAFAGKPVWRAHREHFYQRATQGGWSHARVSALIAFADIVLIALARAAARTGPWLALAAAAVATALILALFQSKYRNRDAA